MTKPVQRTQADLAQFLPPIVRRLAPVRLLMPPERIVARDREIYPIRMTLVVVGVILFAIQVVILMWLGIPTTAGWAAIGLAALLLAAGLLRMGLQHTSMTVGWVVVLSYTLLLHLYFGLAAGAMLFIFPIAMVPFMIYRPAEWFGRIVPVVFALSCCGLIAAYPDLEPWQPLMGWKVQFLLTFNAAGSLYSVLVLASHSAAMRDAAREHIVQERDRADGLLLNILPEAIAARLKDEPGIIADAFDDVTVLFADIVGFTRLSAVISSVELVQMLNELFTEFDHLAARHGLEKIKTIGDAYMAVAGLPGPLEDHAGATAHMALDMIEVVRRYSEQSGRQLDIRIGIHTGPAVAGVIGVNKFAYDLWGDTVNTASRMESHGEPGRIQVSDATRARLAGRFELQERGGLQIKGKGAMQTCFLGAPVARES